MKPSLREEIVQAAVTFAEAIVAAVAERGAAADFYDQTTSPLGKRRHLELARRGVLPAHKDGRKVLVARADMQRYLDAHPKLTREQETGEPSEDEELAARVGLQRVKGGR